MRNDYLLFHQRPPFGLSRVQAPSPHANVLNDNQGDESKGDDERKGKGKGKPAAKQNEGIIDLTGGDESPVSSCWFFVFTAENRYRQICEIWLVMYSRKADVRGRGEGRVFRDTFSNQRPRMTTTDSSPSRAPPEHVPGKAA